MIYKGLRGIVLFDYYYDKSQKIMCVEIYNIEKTVTSLYNSFRLIEE